MISGNVDLQFSGPTITGASEHDHPCLTNSAHTHSARDDVHKMRSRRKTCRGATVQIRRNADAPRGLHACASLRLATFVCDWVCERNFETHCMARTSGSGIDG